MEYILLVYLLSKPFLHRKVILAADVLLAHEEEGRCTFEECSTSCCPSWAHMNVCGLVMAQTENFQMRDSTCAPKQEEICMDWFASSRSWVFSASFKGSLAVYVADTVIGDMFPATAEGIQSYDSGSSHYGGHTTHWNVASRVVRTKQTHLVPRDTTHDLSDTQVAGIQTSGTEVRRQDVLETQSQ